MKTFTTIWLLAFACNTSFVMAEDWPQWMGPGRDNVWEAENTLRKFPAGGPRIIWQAPVKVGYAGPAVAGGRIYVCEFESDADAKISNFDRRPIDGVERIRCLDATTGREIWRQQRSLTYAISYPSGPRCTPIIDSGKVYFLGAEGNLTCYRATDGNIVWSRELKQDYQTNSALWGYASHPLIDGPRLLCLAGGKGSHVVAFDKETGEELWKHGNASEQGYSPVKRIEIDGQAQLVVTSPDYVAGLHPETGQEFWRQPYGASNGSIIMTPVHHKNYIFVGGYSKRNLLLELADGGKTATTVFRDKPRLGLSPVNVQPFHEEDYMIGMDQSGGLMAVEIPSGKRLWTTGQPLDERPVSNGTVFIVKNHDCFFIFCETGELVIAEMDRDGYREIDRAKVLTPTNNAFGRPVVWSAPAFADGKMFVRNDEICVCVDLSKQP